MKTKQTILKAFASLALAMGAFASANAQNTLGADCGCPPVNSRPIVTVDATFPGYVQFPGSFGGELTQGANFTCNNTYVLSKKVYVPANKVLTIAPGTVVKGAYTTVPAEASALIIERGGKIMALGTESCPIVFTTTEDPMDGTYSVSNVGKWGGVVILGRASNNLLLSGNGPFVPGGAGKLAVADGLGTVEGFASSNIQDQYGVALSTPTGYITGTAPAVVSPATSVTYSFDLTGTWTSNQAVTGNKQFKVASEVGSFVLNGMTVTGTGFSGVVTNVASASSGTNTVTVNTTVGGATSGTTGVLSFTGTYPTPGVQGLYYGQSYPASTAQASPYTVLSNATGPIGTNGGVGGNSNINYAIPLGDATVGTFDDNDNSGVLKYVSIRHSGAILAVGAEINGLTLASVGRGTTIDHIEIVSCADDNIEIFGGTVNLKYITTLFGNDDMFDYDLGWTGKAQFFFGMKNTTSGASIDNDNGIEADSDDNATNVTSVAGANNRKRSHPVMYNFTIIGNGKSAGTADNRGLAGANFKEGAEGELYNSIFANFKNGINLQNTTSGRTFEAFDNWSNTAADQDPQAVNNSLLIQCNTFVGCTNSLVIDASHISGDPQGSPAAAPSADNTTQFTTTDKNVVAASITGFSYAFTITDGTTVTVKNDATPTTPLSVSGCPVAPADGFFEPAAYRGAFSSQAGKNWLSDWTYSQVLGATQGLAACPTDIDVDGDTDVDDFLQLLGAFGTSCN
jgi:hypothetical protein